jgi:hypothetical protein
VWSGPCSSTDVRKINPEFRVPNHEKTHDLSPHILSKLEYSDLLKFYRLFAGILQCPKQFISALEITYTRTFVASEEKYVTIIQTFDKKDRSTHTHPLVFRIVIKNGHAFCHA